MTKREVLSSIVLGAEVTEEMVAYAKHEIELMDNKNKNRKRVDKTAEKRELIYNTLVEVGKPINAKGLAEIIDIPQNSISGLMRNVLSEHENVTKVMIKADGDSRKTVHYSIVE